MLRLCLAYLLTLLALAGGVYYLGEKYRLWEGGFVQNHFRVRVTAQLAGKPAAAERADSNQDWHGCLFEFIPGSNQTEGRQTLSPGPDGEMTRFLTPGQWTVEAHGARFTTAGVAAYYGNVSLTLTDKPQAVTLPVSIEPVRTTSQLERHIRDMVLEGDLDRAFDGLLYFDNARKERPGFFREDSDSFPSFMERLLAAAAKFEEYRRLAPEMYNSRYLALTEGLKGLEGLLDGRVPKTIRWRDILIDPQFAPTNLGKARDELVLQHIQNLKTLDEGRMIQEALRNWVFLISNPELDPNFPPSNAEVVKQIDAAREYARAVEQRFMGQLAKQYEAGKAAFYRGDLDEAQRLHSSLKGELAAFQRDLNFRLEFLREVEVLGSDLEAFSLGNRFFEMNQDDMARAEYAKVKNPSILIEERLARMR